jgi:hypothetical protein
LVPAPAAGHIPVGSSGLAQAERIEWSAKTGNGSAVSSAADELKWTNALFGEKYLSARSRTAMLDYTAAAIGYGWFKKVSDRLGVPVFYMNGRAPGFASFIMQVPTAKLSVIVLSNDYISVPSTMGIDLAVLVLGKSIDTPRLRASALSADETQGIQGHYRFNADFYQPNAELTLAINGSDVALTWPTGDVTYLIAIAKDEFIDRSYWQRVSVRRGHDAEVQTLVYSGFIGRKSSIQGPPATIAHDSLGDGPYSWRTLTVNKLLPESERWPGIFSKIDRWQGNSPGSD